MSKRYARLSSGTEALRSSFAINSSAALLSGIVLKIWSCGISGSPSKYICVINRAEFVRRELGAGHLGERVLQRPQRNARRAQHAGLVVRGKCRRVNVAVALVKFEFRCHLAFPRCFVGRDVAFARWIKGDII